VIALDSSALIAIALKEPEREAFAEAIANNRCLIGHATVLESHMVLRDRIGDAGVAFLDALLAQPHITTVDFNDALLPIARLVFDHYGKGRHRAGLNFGDCFAYAVAKAHDVPLLYKGQDFALTDIRPALP
jgi:ribonuclease VapC